MTTRLVLDVDTGTDDAVAIFAAAGHPDLELLGVTAVNGNVALKYTVENSLRVLDHIGSKVPVFAGANRPIVRPDFPIPRHILNGGEDSDFQVNELDFAASTTPAQPVPAVRFLVDTIMADGGDDIVIVATGPLTNVALALASEPRMAARIKRLVVMGGARGWGNVTAAAEFNFWVDPEAAEAVFSAGIGDVLIVPLDATHDAQLSLEDCDAFDAIGTPAATGSAALIRHRIEHYPDDPAAARLTAPVHDALCVAALVRPEVLTEVVEGVVHIETAGEHTLGEMVLDTRPWRTGPPNARVAMRADAQIFAQFLADAFRS
ncbi:MAG TPA: nucleoside hydrolase [Pseudolysinimonas sp.]|jgi:inosine-uridine nucleoside N-ribohydrolase|nr:nucleoside hydrolase [Pseudolysinimonas sp.]